MGRSANASVSVWSAGVTASILALLHILPHGSDLNGAHHWLSEYVLSQNPSAVWLMKFAFVGLALTAFGVAWRTSVRSSRGLFVTAALALGAMTFFDSDPNDGRHLGMSWPLSAGNIHQLLLYVAIGGTLLGMVIETRRSSLIQSRLWMWVAVALAIFATAAQTMLVWQSHERLSMTYYGGITERLVVGAMLIWVVLHSGRLGSKAQQFSLD